MAQLLDQCPSAITFEQRTDLTRLAARTSVCVLIPDIESHTETTQIHPRRLGGDLSVVLQLRSHRRRHRSIPADWVETPAKLMLRPLVLENQSA